MSLEPPTDVAGTSTRVVPERAFIFVRLVPSFRIAKTEISNSPTATPIAAVQIAKSLYSGFTVSVGGSNMPAPTVRLVPGSIKMNEPVSRLWL